jgi:hypothetical protein
VKIKAWLAILYENTLKASLVKIYVFIFMYPEEVFLDLNPLLHQFNIINI